MLLSQRDDEMISVAGALLLVMLQPGDACCRIRMEHEVELQTADTFMPHTQVVRGTDGFYYAAPLVEPGRVAVYRHDGSLHSVIGSFGDGPGEFRDVTRLIPWHGDSVAVIDRLRVTVLPRSGDVGRSFVGVGVFSDIRVGPAGDALAVVGQALFEELRSPAVRVDGVGRIAAEFNLRDVAGDARLAATDGGAFVLADRNDYRIRLYTPEGRLSATFVRRLPWFGMQRSPSGRNYRGGMVREIEFDGRFVWVLLTRIAPPAPPPADIPRGAEGVARRLSVAEAHERTRAYIALVDMVERREVAIASADDHLIRGFTGPARIYTFREAAQGEVRAAVYKLSLAPRP
jgi:hypothetical protein